MFFIIKIAATPHDMYQRKPEGNCFKSFFVLLDLHPSSGVLGTSLPSDQHL
jgi:hypothetical protein